VASLLLVTAMLAPDSQDPYFVVKEVKCQADDRASSIDTGSCPVPGALIPVASVPPRLMALSVKRFLRKSPVFEAGEVIVLGVVRWVSVV